MPRVPLYEEQVIPKTPMIDAPQAASAIPAAFGENVGQATENLGKTMMNATVTISDHIMKMKEEEDVAKALDITSQFQRDLTAKAYSTEKKSITDSAGVVRDIDVGWLNRKRGDALNNASEYQAEIFPQIDTRSKAIRNPKVRSQAERLMISDYDSMNSKIIVHQSAERNEMITDTVSRLVDSRIQAFPSASTQDKKMMIDMTIGTIDSAYKSGVINYEKAEKFKAELYTNTVRNDIYNDNSTQEKESVEVLSELKKGEKGKYSFLPEPIRLKMIKESQDRIFNNNQVFKRQSAFEEFNNTASVIKGVASGKINLNDASVDIQQLAGGNTKLGLALKSAQNSKGNYEPKTDDDALFESYAKDVIATGSMEKLNDLLVDALNATGNKEMSQEKLNILSDLSYVMGKSIRVREQDAKKVKSPVQIAIESGLQTLLKGQVATFSPANLLGEYLKAIATGKSPQEAHSSAIKSEVTRTNPLSLRYKGDGTDPDIVLPDGRIFHITGLTSTGSPKGKIVSGKSSSSTK